MKITTVSVSNFKRVKNVNITPDADRAIILIGGKNGEGKSSTLDALTAAFGGKKALPVDPVRHGAAEAEIVVELDGGLTIRRTIAPNGESSLEVRDEMGAVKAPQSVLEKLVSGRFLDPLQFLAQPAKEQRAQLMRLIKDSDRISTLDEKRERAFTKRTEVGRDLTRAKGELERLPVVEPGHPIDIAALATERDAWAAKERAGDLLVRTLQDRKRDAERARTQLTSTRAEIAKLEAELAALRTREIEEGSDIMTEDEAVTAAQLAFDQNSKVQSDGVARRQELDAGLARADKHNAEVYARRSHMERRDEAGTTVEKLDKEVAELTKVIETIDGRKADILGAAQLPVEGLGIDAEGITLNGVPFVQASAAERLRVALGLAIAAAPQLGDVWVRDGALLDDDSLELVAQQAAAAGKRVWIERVGTKDPGVIVIKDGQVVP